MAWFYELLLFPAQVFLVLLSIGLVISLFSKQDHETLGSKLELEFLNDSLRKFNLKKPTKQEKKALKEVLQKEKKLPSLFVIDYHGDVAASANSLLSEQVFALRSMLKKDDKVVVRIQSPGGSVSGYGLAASLVSSLKEDGVEVIAAIDEVAASGGYMMASACSRIIAAPFAIVGSIGVVTEFPNFNKVLKKYDVDYHVVTAGTDKRDISILGEVNEEDLTKVKSKLEDIHGQFLSMVIENRPNINQKAIMTGKWWTAKPSKELGLIDDIIASDSWLFSQQSNFNIYLIKKHEKAISKLAKSMKESMMSIILQLVRKIS